MDCNIFRKRINDLLEDNIAYDLKNAMLEHIERCESCKSIYKEEKLIDEMFKDGLSVEPQTFRSLRSDIMKNIDKNRYGRNPAKKLIYHIKKYRKSYTSIAALIAIAVFATPYVMKNGIVLAGNKNQSLNSSQAKPMMEATAIQDSNTDMLDTMKKAAEPAADSTLKSGFAVQSTSVYLPKFEKKALDKTYKASFNIPWQDSVSKKYTATVEGKGPDASEEGIGEIILKETATGQQWTFTLVDNEKQFSPKAVKWVDDKNLLIIVGHGYGTVDLGGDLYLLNVDTTSVANADPQNTGKLDQKSQITKLQSIKNLDNGMLSINVEVLVYEDDILNKNHRENRVITSPFNEIVKYVQQSNS